MTTSCEPSSASCAQHTLPYPVRYADAQSPSLTPSVRTLKVQETGKGGATVFEKMRAVSRKAPFILVTNAARLAHRLSCALWQDTDSLLVHFPLRVARADDQKVGGGRATAQQQEEVIVSSLCLCLSATAAPIISALRNRVQSA
jgi:hypothetical protein